MVVWIHTLELADENGKPTGRYRRTERGGSWGPRALCDCPGGHASIEEAENCPKLAPEKRPAYMEQFGRTAEVVRAIERERLRQVEVEGFDDDHDAQHTPGELAQAAACYALVGYWDAPLDGDVPPAAWPWEKAAWKPKDPRRNLVRAAALIVAEIEKLDRGTKKP